MSERVTPEHLQSIRDKHAQRLNVFEYEITLLLREIDAMREEQEGAAVREMLLRRTIAQLQAPPQTITTSNLEPEPRIVASNGLPERLREINARNMYHEDCAAGYTEDEEDTLLDAAALIEQQQGSNHNMTKRTVTEQELHQFIDNHPRKLTKSSFIGGDPPLTNFFDGKERVAQYVWPFMDNPGEFYIFDPD